ncbi:uncharacterized protein A4U43_C07F28010 [Asparagus officinalis]|uniref:Uncharacterized protein n=2 Tax=Asparagus officinalis TaxID=4686 RepID=A0A5P1EFE4_ASPOF|nr:uncharacterized protein A4U43_C07F28010 [Asparagus officinalis]
MAVWLTLLAKKPNVRHHSERYPSSYSNAIKPYALKLERPQRTSETFTCSKMATARFPQLAIMAFVLLAALSSLSLVASHRFMVGSYHASGHLRGKTGHCNTENDSDCCKAGKMYPQYRCSPPITSNTRATMTINSFAKGGDGGGPSECDNKYHSDSEKVVALSTGWYNGGSRCLNYININANGKSVRAKVVDECDSVHGCDADHDFQPPCPNNIVDASPAVWKALDIPESQVGDYDITWSDA